MTKSDKPQSDYDSPWKDVLEQFFPQFMIFFFPQIHAAIDWSKGYVFLDKEFQKVTRDAQTGKRYVDKLVQVYLLNGQETWILIHLEVQGAPEGGFAERMFIYHYRIYDHYRRQVVSLAILTDNQASWRPDHFGYDLFGCRLSLDFPTVKLLDYQQRLDELAVNANPFAVVVMAHLQTQATHRHPAQRYEAKLTLIKFLYQRGYQRQVIAELLRFIDWVMTLPTSLESQLRADVAQFEAEVNMQYITSFERLAREEGMQQGMQQGLQQGVQQGVQQGLQQGVQQGLQQGVQQGLRESILTAVQIRFGDVPQDIVDGVGQVEDLEALRQLQRQAMLLESLPLFKQFLAERLPPAAPAPN
ncbi:MAG: hypothetical protein IAE79_05110 [Anaerolinea sp.]|nr:hypothetical protein [Anaerolinea sp.]